MYYEGVRFAVKDINSFELLENNFQRDRVTGYFERVPIAGSDGATFSVIDMHYSRDKAGVYYSAEWRDHGDMPQRSMRVAGALPESFAAKGAGYAADAGQVYHKGKILGKDVANFQVLPALYAKTSTVIYFDGRPVVGGGCGNLCRAGKPRGERRRPRRARIVFTRCGCGGRAGRLGGEVSFLCALRWRWMAGTPACGPRRAQSLLRRMLGLPTPFGAMRYALRQAQDRLIDALQSATLS